MVNIPHSQLSIAVTLLGNACEQIADAADYVERAGDKPASRELYALGKRTQRAITRIEKKSRQVSTASKSGGDTC